MQKILSWLNAQDKVLLFLRQVGCYKLAIKKYIYSNFKSEKRHCGFKIIIPLTSQGLCPAVDVLFQHCLRLFWLLWQLYVKLSFRQKGMHLRHRSDPEISESRGKTPTGAITCGSGPWIVSDEAQCKMSASIKLWQDFHSVGSVHQL